ncbi:MAG TPA: glycosyltransferase family 2 protein, partial [Cytophagaceae bacterium]
MQSSPESYNQRFIDAKCCVIIPTYNNCTTLEGVINGVLSYTKNILVVNDGSTDLTDSILERFTFLNHIKQAKNKGKGCALQSGFERAIALGYTHAITIDSDGQHFVDDIPKFLDALKEHPASVIIGARNMEQASVPGKSSFGHKFSNFWFWFETGIKAPDTQSGFRLYPLVPLKGMRWYTTKYEFEIEIIVRLAWKGV